MSRDSDPPGDGHARWAFFGFLLLLAVVTVAHPSATRLHVWPWRVGALLWWLLPIALLLHRLVRGRTPLQMPPLLAGGAAAFAVAAGLAAVFSPWRPLSLPHLWPTLGGVGLVVWLADRLHRRPDTATWIERALSASAAGLAGTSVFLWAALPAVPWSDRNLFPFGHANYTAGALVLSLPWLAYQGWKSQGTPRLVWLFVLALGLWALAGTSSRGAVLALLLALGAVAVAAMWRAPWPRGRKVLLALALVLLGVAGVASNPRLRDVALGRGWSADARESNQQRAAMLEAGFHLAAERPLLGWGPGSVPLVYPLVRRELAGGTDSVLQLHNSPVQLLATVGLLGVLGAALLACAPIVARVRGPWEPRAVTAAVSLGSYALYSLTDHQLDLPLANALVASQLALLAAPAGRRLRSLDTRAQRPLAGVLGLLLIAPALATGRDLLARRAYAQEDLAAAHAWMPADPYYIQQEARRFLEQRRVAANPVERQRLTEAAIRALQAALATRAHEEFSHLNLGWLLLETGKAQAASEHFRAAAQLAPTRRGVYLGLGLAEWEQGKSDAAARAVAAEWLNDPAAVTAPLWELPALEALREQALEVLGEASGDAGALAPLVARRVQWIQWWAGRRDVDAGAGFSPSSHTFVQSLPLIARKAPLPTPATDRWARLYEAWRSGDWSHLRINADLEAALQRRAQRQAGDFSAFLRAGTEDDPALLRSYWRQRPGAGVLAFHPDGPPLSDAQLVQENRLVSDWARELFPPKGALPAELLDTMITPPDA